MKTMKLRTLAAAMVVACAPLASQGQVNATSTDVDRQATLLDATAANKGQTQVATRIASSFTKLAGSDENALKLVQALRSGSEVKLTTSTTGTGTSTGTGTGGTGTTATTSFTPPTGKMGWGNVFNSLALAQSELTRLGITNPTNEQLQAALVGGDVTVDGKTTTLKGILTMRADGMGWGQIAQATGTKLGPVVSSIRSTQNKVAALPATEGKRTPATTTATTTTAAGSSTSGPGKSSKGITTAGGAISAGPGAKGLVTAGGASAGSVTHGNSANAPGRGIVTAAGGSAGTTVTHGNSGNKGGAGVVNAGGGNAASVNTAAGNAGGNGNGKGNAGGNGKGKGGG
jgi:hypothetical protein